MDIGSRDLSTFSEKYHAELVLGHLHTCTVQCTFTRIQDDKWGVKYHVIVYAARNAPKILRKSAKVPIRKSASYCTYCTFRSVYNTVSMRQLQLLLKYVNNSAYETLYNLPSEQKTDIHRNFKKITRRVTLIIKCLY